MTVYPFTNYGHFQQDTDGPYLIYRNADGQDWNRMQMGLDGDPPLVVLGDLGVYISSVHPTWGVVDLNGTITNVEFDPSRLVPNNKTVLGFDVPHGTIVQGMQFDGTEVLPPLPPPPYEIGVDTIWDRLGSDDDEIVAFDDAITVGNPLVLPGYSNAQILRFRRQFAASSMLTQNTDLFNFVRNVLLTFVDETRADEILAQ